MISSEKKLKKKKTQKKLSIGSDSGYIRNTAYITLSDFCILILGCKVDTSVSKITV